MVEKANLELQAFWKGTLKKIKFPKVMEAGTFTKNGKQYVEIVIKYQGNLAKILMEKQLDKEIQLEELICGYAVMTLPLELLEKVSEIWEVEYMEKAKGIVFVQDFLLRTDNKLSIYNTAMRTTCILPLKAGLEPLSGRGVLIAIIDSGVQGNLPAFLDEGGNSRLVEGSSFQDDSGHGTAVASIAAGRDLGVAPNALLFAYRLKNEGFFLKSTDLMRGVTYALKEAKERRMPLVINLSIGYTYGSHRGDSLLERFLDNASEIGRTVIVVGAGNEGESNGHISLVTRETQDEEIELMIGEYEEELVLEMFLGYMRLVRLEIESPNGEVSYINGNETIVEIQGTLLYIYIEETTPYSGRKQIYLQWMSRFQFITTGVWKIRWRATNILDGIVEAYIATGNTRNQDTGFYRSQAEGTITMPATAQKVISVGSCDLYGTRVSSFSGRGYRQAANGYWQNKPDLVAPGEDLPAFNREGEVIRVTGTSYAAPLVTGAVALAMEQKLVRGQDMNYYGQKCKNRLIEGCLPIRGEQRTPSEKAGWGLLCLQRSLTR